MYRYYVYLYLVIKYYYLTLTHSCFLHIIYQIFKLSLTKNLEIFIYEITSVLNGIHHTILLVQLSLHVD